jgi:hypothetical protein
MGPVMLGVGGWRIPAGDRPLATAAAAAANPEGDKPGRSMFGLRDNLPIGPLPPGIADCADTGPQIGLFPLTGTGTP